MSEELSYTKGVVVDVSGSGCIKVKGVDVSHAALTKILPTNKKCCEKCAFRAGSPERRDPYVWGDLCDAFSHGGSFLCHEGVPGHEDGKPGAPLSLCAGRAAMEGRSFGTMLNLAQIWPIENDNKGDTA